MEILVRKAGVRDTEDIHRWRNHPPSRAMYLNTEGIALDSHRRWFLDSLENPRRHMYIGEVGAEKIGICRFDIGADPEVAEVFLTLNPAMCGKGLSGAFLRTAIAAFLGSGGGRRGGSGRRYGSATSPASSASPRPVSCRRTAMATGISTLFGQEPMSHSRAFHVMFPRFETADQSPFVPIIETLVWGLRELGHDASSAFGTSRENATHIVLCPHLLDSVALARLAPDTILYNLDQIAPASPMPPSRLWDFRHWRIWDFSPRNRAIWNSLGIDATIVPVGWYPGLERVPVAGPPDIDVLFFGQLNPRRKALLERIAGRGWNVGACNGIFGRELDELIARSKIVLNIHYYPTHLLETMRLSYLLANGRAVVSERSLRTEVPAVYEPAVRWATYEDLPDACHEVVGDANERERMAAAGRAAMRELAIAPLLAAALSADSARGAPQ